MDQEVPGGTDVGTGSTTTEGSDVGTGSTTGGGDEDGSADTEPEPEEN